MCNPKPCTWAVKGKLDNVYFYWIEISMSLVYSEVINLQISAERRGLMDREFEKAGVSVHFYPAVHFQDVEEDDLLRFFKTTGPWGKTSPGHMATTISHMKAWERFLETEFSHCAIFEDDVFGSPELCDWFDDLKWWPADADIVKIEKWRNDNPKVLLEPPISQKKGRVIQKLLSRHMGEAGYMLTRKSAKMLIQSRPYNKVVDHLLFNFNASPETRKMNVYQVEPSLVTQGNEPVGSTMMAPSGKLPIWELLRQETRRGILEFSFPISTYKNFFSGQAKFTKLSYQAHTNAAEENNTKVDCQEVSVDV